MIDQDLTDEEVDLICESIVEGTMWSPDHVALDLAGDGWQASIANLRSCGHKTMKEALQSLKNKFKKR